ncbi:hypothetical protein GZH47_33765 (plasmid) [Paenibacillus rhizovicinus]|uniref:Uncharacterized protein n=1 Tax=Paenibacillus rhizovicinus TaxID=2704463 RepID=A0A6C0PBA0_9BACL|nr:hypothetical protein [Paenibacillus rhizovicinus]QHW35860.1 hypothetical protein GZH47_33765 [Paenibacillus rhizovicinus]
MIKAAVQYLTITPAILIMVAELVKTFEVEGNGEQKKEAVLEAVDMTYDELGKVVELKISKDFVHSVAERSIGVVVNFYNLVGIFTKKKQT